MTHSSNRRDLEWAVCGRYKLDAREVRAVSEDWRKYYPSDIKDLPGKLITVLGGQGALLRFISEYGFLGYYSDFTFTVQDWLRGEEDDLYERWREEREAGGEELCVIRAHATTLLALKYAAAFLSEPNSMRVSWRRFIQEHQRDCVVIHNQRLTELIKLPVAANIEPDPPNQLFPRELPDETNARVLIAVLFENNFRRGVYPGLTVPLNGKPEIEFQFDSLINLIYWKLYEQLSRSFTRICPCGKFFHTQNSLQRHHDAQCTNRMNQRRFRERNNPKNRSDDESKETTTKAQGNV